MNYYKMLGLNKEPFSTSPDPAFFYHSAEHTTALHRLEITIRLRRGLSLILGDVGTGKTTLSRTLLQSFNKEKDYIFHIILDPTYRSEFQFLTSLAKLLGATPTFRSTPDYREAIQNYLFQKGVKEKRMIVLIIDEGQKLPLPFLEILRTLLNYETNDYKLLQLVIMAQMEILPKLKKVRNFMDRVNLKYIINPLDARETAQMIKFRLNKAGLLPGQELFTPEAVSMIFEYSKGYPRKIAHICHNALEFLVMMEKEIVNPEDIRTILKDEVSWNEQEAFT